MSETRQQNAPLYFGFVIAVMLHFLVVVPVLSASWGVGGKSPLDSALDGNSASERRQRERLEAALKKALAEAQNKEDDEVVPGLEDGSDEGMTWIGYNEYQEQLAQHAEVEQAGFTEKDAAGGGALAQGEMQQGPAAAPGPQAQPQPPAQQSPPSLPTPEQPTPTEQAQNEPTPPAPAAKPIEAVRAASPSETPQPSDQAGIAPAPVQREDLPSAPLGPDAVVPAGLDRPDVQPDPSKILPPTAPVNPTLTPDPVAREEVQPTQQTAQSQIPAQPNQTPPAPQSPASPPPQANAGAQGATSPVVAPVAGPPGSVGASQTSGEKSDRESDATSIADVPPSLWRTGKPLARKGLEIKTKKPELPILTRLTTSPSNPICEILFGRDGVPVACKILQSSGFEEINGPVLDALYRWRAKGSQLEKLAPGKTLRFRVRFILN